MKIETKNLKWHEHNLECQKDNIKRALLAVRKWKLKNG